MGMGAPAEEVRFDARDVAAGDTIHTHKFTGVGWLKGATLTVKLVDPALLALGLCVDAEAGVCLVGALGLWLGCVA